MKAYEIIMIIFASVIALISLIMMFRNYKRRDDDSLGYFQELVLGPDGKTYKKFSSTTFLSFLFALFLFMGDLVFITVIADNVGKETVNWQFNVTFMIFNVFFILGVFAPKQLKNIDYKELISIIKPTGK